MADIYGGAKAVLGEKAMEAGISRGGWKKQECGKSCGGLKNTVKDGKSCGG